MISKFKKNKRSVNSPTSIFQILIILVFTGLIGFLTITDFKLNKKREESLSRLKDLKQKIQTLEKENEIFKKDISQIGSSEYLEKIAREQLNLKACGEEVVVVKKEAEENKVQTEEKKGWWDQLKNVFNFLK